MKLPKFDLSIPVSLDINKPNRYGYSKLSEIAQDYSIEICMYEDKNDSSHHISADDENCMYLSTETHYTLYAQLEQQKESTLFYSYLSKDFQRNCLINNSFKENNLCPISIEDCYLCAENYQQGVNVFSRYVIDLYKRRNSNYPDDIEKEINDLVCLFRQKGFTRSKQISNYIRRNKLGLRFKNIAGYLEMSDGIDNWIFEGGIDPIYYREICKRLGVTDEGSASIPVSFESYKEHETSRN